jgi:hypothetical protein
LVTTNVLPHTIITMTMPASAQERREITESPAFSYRALSQRMAAPRA